MTIKRYRDDELHGFMFPDYKAEEPRWIDAHERDFEIEALRTLLHEFLSRDYVHSQCDCLKCADLRVRANLLLGGGK
jgi:hypothetical protein